MKKVRFGIVGLGNQGTYYTSLFDGGEIPDGEITAMCDIAPSKIRAMRERGERGVRYFSDYREMLDSGLCDAVLIETPHYLHPEIAEECLKRGIHVLCDKPAGVYTEQVARMNAAAAKSGALFGMMFNQRTNCVYRKMREMVAAGEIGRLQRVVWIITHWFRSQCYYDTGSWRATWKGEGGGVLINQCPHQLDLVEWVTGEIPVAVRGFCGYGKWHDIEVEDDVTAFFEYANGATGVFVTTTGECPGVNRLEISGTKGRLVCDGERLWLYKNAQDSLEFSRTTDKVFGTPEVTEEEIPTDGSNPQHVGILNNFAAAVLGKERLFVPGEEGIHGVELMNAIELSGWNGGERISLPIDGARYKRELDLRCAGSKEKAAVRERVADTAGTF